MNRQEHGEQGHLNIYKRDHDSVVTGYGKHDRVVACLPCYWDNIQAVAVYIRIDHKWQLGIPTDKEVITAFKKDQGITGRWKKALESNWSESNATEQWYIKSGV
jgi:hypothetical protein